MSEQQISKKDLAMSEELNQKAHEFVDAVRRYGGSAMILADTDLESCDCKSCIIKGLEGKEDKLTILVSSLFLAGEDGEDADFHKIFSNGHKIAEAIKNGGGVEELAKALHDIK